MESVLNMSISPTAVVMVLTAALGLSLLVVNKQKKAQQINNENGITKVQTLEKIRLENNQIKPEILAVITAAVAISMQTKNMYRITTIKRIDISSNWKMINKYEQIKANN